MLQPKTAYLGQKNLSYSRELSGILVVCLSAFISASIACRKRVTTLTLKSPATGERQITGKPSYTFAVSSGSRLRASNTAQYHIYTANYDLDPSHLGLSMSKPLTSDDHVRLQILLFGGPDTTEESPPKEGIYLVHGDDGRGVNVIIYSRQNGIENRTVLNVDTPLSGQVKVTSVSRDWLAADVDLTAGETSLKGTFEAKILGRNK
jgi:hypothetical protein